MFIRTQHGFVPGTEIEIKLFLPDGEIANLKGIVRRTIKTPHHFIKNGMGIELTWKDSTFENFLTQELLEYQRDYAEKESSPGSNKVEDFTIMVCPSCGVKNRLKGLSRALRAKCGRCGAYLS
ncbi:MAG: hypothetical protein D6710_07570 [Nitrospirae bacterium]|nr:MAG: hypothetical protein D6710_07570 [Nitrospirota bacterium]